MCVTVTHASVSVGDLGGRASVGLAPNAVQALVLPLVFLQQILVLLQLAPVVLQVDVALLSLSMNLKYTNICNTW